MKKTIICLFAKIFKKIYFIRQKISTLISWDITPFCFESSSQSISVNLFRLRYNSLREFYLHPSPHLFLQSKHCFCQMQHMKGSRRSPKGKRTIDRTTIVTWNEITFETQRNGWELVRWTESELLKLRSPNQILPIDLPMHTLTALFNALRKLAQFIFGPGQKFNRNFRASKREKLMKKKTIV